MGFLDSLFGKKKEIDPVKLEVDGLKAELVKSMSNVKEEINQIIKVLSTFDEDLVAIKRNLKIEQDKSVKDIEKAIQSFNSLNSKNERVIREFKGRIEDLEKTLGDLKTIGKVSIQNYDALKTVNLKLKKLDRIDILEKSLLEHISTTPEAVVSKDEYIEEMEALKNRLFDLEYPEDISAKKRKGTFELQKGRNSSKKNEVILINSEKKQVKRKRVR